LFSAGKPRPCGAPPNNILSSPARAQIYKKCKNRRALPAVFATRKEERKNEKEENNETLYLYNILEL
jgi:hypothetical protein